DLYYRLNVVNILVPPLRERPEEIPILAEHFWQKYTRQYNRQRVHLSPNLMMRFQAHPWPGNVRELENLVKRIVVLESEEFVTPELAAREAGPSRPAAPEAGAPERARRTSAPDANGGAEPSPAPAWTPGVGLKDVARKAAREAEQLVIKHVLE